MVGLYARASARVPLDTSMIHAFKSGDTQTLDTAIGTSGNVQHAASDIASNVCAGVVGLVAKELKLV